MTEFHRFAAPGRGLSAAGFLGVVLAVASALHGAQKDPSKDSKKSRQEEGKQVLSPRPGGQGSGGGPGAGGDVQTGPSRWVIVLETYSGDDAAAQANNRAGEVASILNRRDVSVMTTPRGAAVVLGSYSSISAPEAQADLRTVRERAEGGRLLFTQAFLAPPAGADDPGQVPELNLLNARKTFGKEVKYTLQVGVYQSADHVQAKRAAEQAALKLRREGELAFYFHGETMSVVTVGVFSDRDFDGSLRPKNPMIRALQERYPLNLLNGQFPIVEKRPGQPDQQQPSSLVAIP